ncbi:MAG: diadenylate cyclase [Bacteroidota bacterium]
MPRTSGICRSTNRRLRFSRAATKAPATRAVSGSTTAPGHDGAVLSDGQRILKFGVHLPLSTNLHKLSRSGTRHTAALGLSEQCDALVIVVSEERGAISIAQNGQIKELESHSDLKKHLDDFWAENYQSDSASFKQ